MDNNLKTTGYILLAVGLVMIFGAIIQIILVFSSIIEPVKLFSFESSDFALDANALMPQIPSNLTSGLKVEFFPAELINTSLNLGANTILMSIIIFAGSKVSSIGVQLLRPIYVKMKENG